MQFNFVIVRAWIEIWNALFILSEMHSKQHWFVGTVGTYLDFRTLASSQKLFYKNSSTNLMEVNYVIQFMNLKRYISES